MSAWVQHGGVPELDGNYYTRMDDEDEDEPLFVSVREGKAYKEDGKQRIFMNHEWKKVSL